MCDRSVRDGSATPASSWAPAWLFRGPLSAWSHVGRQLVSFGELALAPLYALRKLPVYLRFVLGRQVEWVRAKRDGE